MSTRESILQLADTLIRDKGYNAFSFNDISKSIGIKTASVHYHFPTKTDLGIAIVRTHIERVTALRAAQKDQPPLKKLESFLSIYTKVKAENKVCIVGSLATDLLTVEEEMKSELKILTKLILEWVTEILEEGRTKKVFTFEGLARTKALMVITNMLASVQLTRLTDNPNDFEIIKSTILADLLHKK
ncbi:TetR/AcrR family transcriptional regulator [Runella sp.]|uniref:TetR/AcrR family transcriptional regulator n=1 Tax=Runella sp. TaxID=1960881 RepID=UPI003D0D43B3